MRVFKRTISFLLFIGITGIQFISLIDDIHHITEPDPDCFFCMVSQTSVDINHAINIEFTPDIVTYLIDYTYLEPYSNYYLRNLSTRAPPFILAS